MICFVGYSVKDKMVVDKDTGEIYRLECVRVNFTDNKCYGVSGLDVQSYTVLKSDFRAVFGLSCVDDLLLFLGKRCVLSFRMSFKGHRSFLNKVEFLSA